MDPLDSIVSFNWQFEDIDLDIGVNQASASVYGSRLPSSLALGPHYHPDTLNQANFDPVDVQDHSSAFLAPDTLFNSNANDSDVVFTSQNQTQVHVPWIPPECGVAPVFTEEPVMHSIAQNSNELLCDSVSFDPPPPVSDTTNYYPLTSSLDREMAGSFQDIADHYAFTVMGIPNPGWDIDQQERNSPTFNHADPAVRIDGSSYTGGVIQMANTEVVQSPFHTASPLSAPQSIPPRQSTCQCQWIEDGTICGDDLTPEILSEHLSKHGIKNMSRNRLTRCNWAGCKTRKPGPMNRESMLRHVREVHLRVKRHSKKV